MGVVYYSGFIPCLVASLVAYGISRLIGIAPMGFDMIFEPLQVGMILRTCLLAVVCAVVSIVFCVTMHQTERLAAAKIKNAYLRGAVGGVVLIVLTKLAGSYDYNGIGTQMIASALAGADTPDWAFFWKIVFTAVTIGFGFKGGEIVPTFFIGGNARLCARPRARHASGLCGGNCARCDVLRGGQLPDSVDNPERRAFRLV